jgi:L-lactate dehydrogenase
VDIMTRVTQKISGFDSRRVIGTGTTLDTARLRYMLGDYFKVDPRNVHAYVMGEHGDTEFVPWSQAMVATKPVLSICEESCSKYCYAHMAKLSEDVKNAAQQIIQAKKATYYGIGMAMVRIVRAIFGNENSILTVSTMLDGEYNQTKVYTGVPAVVNRNGVDQIVSLSLTSEEQEKLQTSCDMLRNSFDGIGL